MDIGARLKEARVSKGLSLDELQEITKIQKRYLAAIEEGKFEILPGKFYAKAFIREYANAVGINPNELLEEYTNEIPKTDSDESESTNVELSRIERSRKESFEKNNKLFSKFPTIIVILLVIGIIFVVIFFNMHDNNTASEEPLEDTEIIINNPNDSKENGKKDAVEEDKSEENEAEENETEENAEEDNLVEDENESVDESEPEFSVIEEGTGSSPRSTLQLKNVGEEITINFETETRTWLDVQKDGESLFSSTLEVENTPLELDLSGANEVFLNIGNASDLIIKINDVELPFPVDPKKFVHQQLMIHISDEIE